MSWITCAAVLPSPNPQAHAHVAVAVARGVTEAAGQPIAADAKVRHGWAIGCDSGHVRSRDTARSLVVGGVQGDAVDAAGRVGVTRIPGVELAPSPKSQA